MNLALQLQSALEGFLEQGCVYILISKSDRSLLGFITGKKNPRPIDCSKVEYFCKSLDNRNLN